MVTRKFAFELSLTLTLLTARAGYAVDLEGEHGSVASVEISTSSADTYLQYHGELLVLNSATKTLDNYRWDGTSCGARLLTEG